MPFAKLEWISLHQNCIDNWDSIEALARFPALTDMRFQNNPVFGSLRSSEVRLLLAARIPTLKTLNFSEVRLKERTEGEKFYLLEALLAERKERQLNAPMVEVVLESKETISLSAEFLSHNAQLPRLLHKYGVPVMLLQDAEICETCLARRLLGMTLLSCGPLFSCVLIL